MKLPVMPPVQPMLAAITKEIPPGQQYEPKWDGFRAIIFRDGDEILIGSRNTKPIERYFPELVAALRSTLPQRCVLDGEIVIQNSDGVLDFPALQQRIHPAESRINKLSRETPAQFVAFDCLALGADALLEEPLSRRRKILAGALDFTADPLVALTPATDDLELAREWFIEFEARGVEGIVAKRHDLKYLPGQRAMTKIKHVRTADCVVAGYRPYKGDAHAIGSLLLGLYTEAGELASVGIVGTFSQRRRRELFEELQPLVTTLTGHPWAPIVDDATPVGSASSAAAGARKPQDAAVSRWSGNKNLEFVRWRTDRDPQSCTFAQLEQPEADKKSP